MSDSSRGSELGLLTVNESYVCAAVPTELGINPVSVTCVTNDRDQES